jgi:uridine kinase
VAGSEGGTPAETPALAPGVRDRLGRWLEPVDVPAGATVVEQGGRDRDLYVCLGGEAVVSRGGVEMERLGPGAWFGELALILAAPRAATVTARTPLRLARLSHASYRELARAEPDLALALVEALLDAVAARLGHVSDSVGQLLRDQSLPRRAEVLVRVLGAAPRAVAMGTPIAALLPAQVGDHPVVAALWGHKPVSLPTRLTSSGAIDALTTAHWEGQRVYRESLALLFLDAVEHVRRASDAAWQVELAHSVGFARRARVTGEPPRGLEAIAGDVATAMRALAARALPLAEELWSVDEAEDYFRRLGARHTVALLRAWRGAAVRVASLGGRYRLRTGPLVPHTGLLRDFDVLADEEGLLLAYARLASADPVAPPGDAARPARASAPWDAGTARSVSRHAKTLVGAAEPWQRALGIDSLGAFNTACVEGSVPRLIRVNEGFHEKSIGGIADAIVARGAGTRIVCIAGPSSSGKTTFIERLKVQLHVNGKNPIGISLDDYYRDRAHTPRDASGEYDFEALLALDLPLLREQLAALLRGERVRLARYDFASATSHPRGGAELALGRDDLLMLEGIHALNPEILDTSAQAHVFRVFVCPLGQLPVDEVTRVHGSDLRLLRRLVRDRHTRATGAEASILRWPAVRRGERAHIFPFQHTADAVFDSGLLYELSVLKVFAERYLLEVPQASPAYPTAFRLLSLLDRVVTVYPDHVPQISILREFIGRGGYEY